MRTKSFLQCSLLMNAAAVLALCLPARAQLSTVQLQEWLNSPAATSHIGNITGNAKAAAMPYRRYCVGCHGDLGDGNGENAVWLDPKPRDFQLAIFKCRSTPTGTLPTDEDLYDKPSGLRLAQRIQLAAPGRNRPFTRPEFELERIVDRL